MYQWLQLIYQLFTTLSQSWSPKTFRLRAGNCQEEELTEPLRLVKQEPIDRIDMVLRLMQNRSDEQRTLRSRSVRSRPKRPKCPKLIGAVKRIVATTKEYVEAWRRLLEGVESVFVFSEMVGMWVVFNVAVRHLLPSLEVTTKLT